MKQMRFWIWFFGLCAMMSTLAAQSSQVEQESNLKAAFIYNFTRYIEWEPSGEPVFTIGVVGFSPVTAALINISKSYKVNEKNIVVKVFDTPEDIDNCQILFIPQNLPWPLRSILDKCSRGMLTISEQQGYSLQGTAFNFIINKDKLKFESNLGAINSAGLKAGSQLLKLAIIVK